MFCGTKSLHHRSQRIYWVVEVSSHNHPLLYSSSRSSPDSETSSYFVSFLKDQVYALLIKKLRKIICWGGNNSHLGMFFHYTHISCSMGPLGACTKFRFLNKFVDLPECDSDATVDVQLELKCSQQLPWSQANICTYHTATVADSSAQWSLWSMMFNLSLQNLLGVFMLDSLHLLSSSQCYRFLDQTKQH